MFFFYNQADRKGGISPLGPDCKQMWKFWPILALKLDSLIPKKTIHLIVSVLKNALFMTLWWLTPQMLLKILTLCFTALFYDFPKTKTKKNTQEIVL